MKMIFPLTVTMLMFYLCFFPVTFGKTIHGVFSSDAARKGSGQYITKFLFHGGNALMVYRLEDVSTAMKKDARLLLFQDLEKFDNLSCQHRLSRARLSMTLSAEEHNQTIPHTAASPRAWYVLYADRYTCHQDKIAEDLKDLRFQIMLFNPNAEGDPLDHFSAEEAVCNMVSQVHMVFMLLSLCMGWTLSSRKTQSKPLQWDTSPTSTALALGSVAIQMCLQGALLVWEQFEDTDHHSYHAHGSTAGLLLVALRVVLALLLTSILYRIVRAERSGLKRDYYLSFAKGCLLWFLCHPVLVLLSAAFNEHHRQKVTTIGVILCQSISVVVLYRLFLCRSLYWEVSSPSSVTLPLTMSRDRRCPY
ncbi:integral membrane protein GPR180-like isoform X4 [Scleropages formosus]|uniref:integral membrane protein GPR180-like isoform X4 n=1 Tax=Scleropages formosus TaxID=113540 RepID=UPI000878D6F8|nr:integral membrane protein GPR180-like isoform X4 [Scleropages formosus]